MSEPINNFIMHSFRIEEYFNEKQQIIRTERSPSTPANLNFRDSLPEELVAKRIFSGWVTSPTTVEYNVSEYLVPERINHPENPIKDCTFTHSKTKTMTFRSHSAPPSIPQKHSLLPKNETVMPIGPNVSLRKIQKAPINSFTCISEEE